MAGAGIEEKGVGDPEYKVRCTRLWGCGVVWFSINRQDSRRFWGQRDVNSKTGWWDVRVGSSIRSF